MESIFTQSSNTSEYRYAIFKQPNGNIYIMYYNNNTNVQLSTNTKSYDFTNFVDFFLNTEYNRYFIIPINFDLTQRKIYMLRYIIKRTNSTNIRNTSQQILSLLVNNIVIIYNIPMTDRNIKNVFIQI